MNAAPQPSAFERRTNATFEALMWALSRPGLARTLPGQGAALVAEALLDRECRAWCATPELQEAVRRTGAELVEPEQADHVFAGALSDSGLVARLAVGSDLHPEDGATLIVSARFGEGQALRLTGPGIETHLDVQLGGLPGDFWEKRARLARYPMGFDMVLIDDDRVIGLSRSTQVEVR